VHLSPRCKPRRFKHKHMFFLPEQLALTAVVTSAMDTTTAIALLVASVSCFTGSGDEDVKDDG